MEFEWDPTKNRKNVLKHGISFEDAVVIFSDFNALELSDKTLFEERMVRIGLNPYIGILVVIYCERKGNTIRLISARKATTNERKMYEERI
jgi:uncharacterized DUF497 family protein